MIRSGASAGDLLELDAVGVAEHLGQLGVAEQRRCAHGKMSPGASPNHLVTATGTTPSSSRASCSVSPTLTTRFGASAGTVVSPYLCATTDRERAESASAALGAAGRLCYRTGDQRRSGEAAEDSSSAVTAIVR